MPDYAPYGKPLDPERARRLRKLLKSVGEAAASDMLELPRATLWKAAARGPLLNGTREILERALDTKVAA